MGNKLYKISYEGEYGDNHFILADSIKEALDKSNPAKEVVQISLVTNDIVV